MNKIKTKYYWNGNIIGREYNIIRWFLLIYIILFSQIFSYSLYNYGFVLYYYILVVVLNISFPLLLYYYIYIRKIFPSIPLWITTELWFLVPIWPFPIMLSLCPGEIHLSIVAGFFLLASTILLIKKYEREELLVISPCERFMNELDICKYTKILLKKKGFKCGPLNEKLGYIFSVDFRKKRICEISVQKRLGDYFIIIHGNITTPISLKMKREIIMGFKNISSKEKISIKYHDTTQRKSIKMCFLCGKKSPSFFGRRLFCCHQILCNDCIKQWKKNAYKNQGKCMICKIPVLTRSLNRTKND